ncbi:hypothetical protein JYK21_29825 [Ralstonia pickettii]|nr:hypothetical protein [Ralstonia pickettii]
MMAVAKLAAAMLGTSTVVNGLACVPTSPASLQVNVNPGEMYSLVNVDATAYSSLAADTTHSILKQGISLDAVTLSCPAPATGGQSINYLIQAAYQDTDTDNVALPYYNASNPSQAWSGPANSGTPQSTTRKGAISISAKAGTAATTGSQTTPAPDSGHTGLWVVTVANGQSTITASNITQATNAPILPSDLLHAIQQSSLTVASDTGSANTYVVSYSPAVTTLVDGMVLWFKAKTANTGASTLNVNGLGAMPLVGGAHAALQSGEIVANGKCQVVYKADITSFVLIECTGGAVQVAPATQSQQAPQLGQVLSMRARYTSNGSFTVPAGVTQIWVSGCAGGGGGGGGAGANGSAATSAGGGGGGAGQSIIRVPYTVTSGQSISITIGAGGTVGAGGANGANNGGAGGAGGNTVVGSLVTLTGGSGGGGGISSGASGGSGGTGFPNGSYGDDGVAFCGGGAGASSPFGGGGGRARGAVTIAIAGFAASGFGSGGGGGSGPYNAVSASGANGGAGAPGIVFIEW